MSLAATHREVEELLVANPVAVENRRQSVAALNKALSEFNCDLPMLRRRQGWFSTTQTNTLNAKGIIQLQLLGLDVGRLELRTNQDGGSCLWLIPKDRSKGPWQWSHHAKDAKAIRQYLKDCANHPKANADQEREIQWCLAYDLERPSKLLALRNLQPVTWNGLYTEIGVSVNRIGKVTGTGNIDLVVRRKRGFLVLELKKPGERNIRKALEQTLRYATALNFEANKGTKNNLQNYRSVLGAQGHHRLRIGAVIVMEDFGPKFQKSAEGLLKQYWFDRGESEIDRLGMLLYRFDRSSGKAKDWHWLPGWDPRTASLVAVDE